jgi:hypothetical protein
VSYAYNGSSDTLALNGSKNYQVKAHTQPPQNITVPGGMSVSIAATHSGNEYVFEDIPHINIHVVNTQNFNVSIAEKSNYIENDDGNPFIECQNQATTSGKIYTKTPNFYSLPKHSSGEENPSYPVFFDYHISDDGEMYLTIR